jgi:hypothetical protein
MRAYETAIGNVEPIVIGADRARAGTVAATIGMMFASVAFADLADATQRMRRGILEKFREEHGDKRIASIERKHMQALVDAKAATPSAARNFLAVVRSTRASAPTIRRSESSASKSRAVALSRGRNITSPPSKHGTRSARCHGSLLS